MEASEIRAGVAERSASISVVVPCFNREKFIAEALESALAQSRRPDQIIVVDDGSTDRSADVAERYTDQVVRLSTNRGASAARNVGVSLSKCDLIAVLDSDDIWEPDHLETVVGLLERHPQAAVAASAARVFGGDDEGVFYPRMPPETSVDIFSEALRTWVLLPTVSVMRREAVLEVGGYYEGDSGGADDYDLMLRLSARHRFVATHRITGRWRHHPGQLSASYLRQVRAVYWFRQRFLNGTAIGELPRPGAELERMVRQIWSDDLTRAWQNRDWPLFRTVWECREHVPDLSTTTLLRWRVRRYSAPLVASTWDRLPLSVRGAVKRPLRKAAALASGVRG